MKRSKLFALILMIGGLLAVTPAEAAMKGSMTRDFITQATVSNGFEIMTSRLALERSRNPEVRDFAQRMIDDHRRADDDLRNAVMSSGYRMRGMPTNLDSAHRAKLRQLERSSGPDFDRRYVQMQTAAHNSAVRLFSRYADHGSNHELREYAARYLPALEEHQEHVRHIRIYR